MYRNNKLCRLCLVEVDSLVPIFTTKNVSETSSLQMKIMELANVQVYAGDGLPSSVCLNCSKLLDSYHAFKVQIEKADVILRHQLSTNQVDPLSIETKVEGETTDADVLKAETVLIKEEEIPEDQVENILQPSLSPSATHSPLPSPSASPVPASPVNNDEDDETPDGHDNEVDPLSADITDPPDPPTDSTTVVEQDTMSPPVSVPIPVVSSVGNQVISSVPIISSGINQNTTLAPVSVISTGVNQVASISQLPVISSVTGGVNRTTNLASVPVISSGTNQATNLAPLPIISSVSGSVNQATSLASVPVISGGGVNQPTGLLLVATPLIVSSNSKNQDLNKKSVTTVVGNTNTFVAVPTLSSVTAPTTFVTVPSSTVTSATFNLDKTSIESKDPLDVSNNDPGPSTSNAGINKVGESSSSNEAQPKVESGIKSFTCRSYDTNSTSIDSLNCQSNILPDSGKELTTSECGGRKTCDLCGIICSSFIKYREHRSNHDKQCNICGRVLSSFRSLKRHKLLIHSTDRIYELIRCKICGKLYEENYMKFHINVHSNRVKKFECDVCQKKFHTEKIVKLHKQYVHIEKTEYVSCSECNKLFKNKYTLNNHMQKIHSDDRRSVCEICGANVKDMKSHINSCHTENSAAVVCELCGKTFSRNKYLKRHKMTHAEVRPFECDVCKLKFKTNEVLKKHLLIHGDIRMHKCELCGKTFKQKTALRTHIRVHNNFEPYECLTCGEKFKWKSTFDKHRKKCPGNINNG
ncbi:uncharacterized protein LOC142326076 isoform X4 [Lycorma delicatula]|uniref:uncharacterized protein LOC142326076 isoform X4 n=1 Tax=Lycorma delicatula TaxID=130591 RepID=UPI003F5191D9